MVRLSMVYWSRSLSRALGLTVVLVLLTLTLGCRNIKPPDNEIKDPQILMAAMSARLEQVDTARFKEVVFEYYGEERIKLRQLILVKAPAKLRVHTRMPGSDEVINVLVSNGDTFSMHRRDTNEYITGKPTRENINRLLPLDLSAHDVSRVMLGGAPLDRFASEKGPVKLNWDKRKGHYVLSTQTHKGGEFRIRVRHTDFAVLGVAEVDEKGKDVYSYTTKSWESHAPLSLPDWRRFEWPSEKIDFSVDVGETQLGVNLDDALFSLDPPAGSRVIVLD